MAEVVVSAVYGGYDTIRPQAEQDVDTTWRLYTDDPDLEAPEPWEVVHEAPRNLHPCLAAKYRKMTPPRPRAVWVDANMEVTSSSFVREALDSAENGLAVYRHPRRDCIYEEAEASLGAESQGGKYDGLPIREQAEHYRAEGHPEHWGLWACGVLAWDGATLGRAWLAECARWTYQDQISFPAVLRRAGTRPGEFDHPQIERSRRGYLENRWLRIHPHLNG